MIGSINHISYNDGSCTAFINGNDPQSNLSNYLVTEVATASIIASRLFHKSDSKMSFVKNIIFQCSIFLLLF